MKTKFFTLFAILSIAFFSSCSKDDSSNDVETTESATEGATSLVGDYYSAYYYTGGGYYFMSVYVSEYDVYTSYRFVDETNAEKTSNQISPYGSIIGDPDPCTYVYNYPAIVFTFDDGSTISAEFIGSNAFRIGNQNYTKQN